MNDISYIPNFLGKGQADYLLKILLNEVDWQTPINAEGKTSKVKRKMAYMADHVSDYNYANMNLKGVAFHPVVSYYRTLIGFHIGPDFNSVLLNLYEDGRSEIRWHSDKEPQLGESPIIPTLNLGASRTFWFMHKISGEKTGYILNHGDLLVMGPNCQQTYLHAILKEPEVKEPRISLTFRQVI